MSDKDKIIELIDNRIQKLEDDNIAWSENTGHYNIVYDRDIKNLIRLKNDIINLFAEKK